MTFRARVADKSAASGFSNIDVTDRFGDVSSIEAAAESLKDNGYSVGHIFAAEDSVEVLHLIENGFSSDKALSLGNE